MSSISGEYKIGSFDEGDYLTTSPRLMIIDQSFGLCPNGCVDCRDACDVSVTLEVVDSFPAEFITLSDTNKNQATTFIAGRNVYRIQSTNSRVDSSGSYLGYRVDYIGEIRLTS